MCGPCEARTHDLGVAIGSEIQVYQHRALPTELTDHHLPLGEKIKDLLELKYFKSIFGIFR